MKIACTKNNICLYEYKADRKRRFNRFSEQRRRETSTGLHLKDSLFLSNFNQALIFSTDFRKTLKDQIS